MPLQTTEPRVRGTGAQQQPTGSRRALIFLQVGPRAACPQGAGSWHGGGAAHRGVEFGREKAFWGAGEGQGLGVRVGAPRCPHLKPPAKSFPGPCFSLSRGARRGQAGVLPPGASGPAPSCLRMPTLAGRALATTLLLSRVAQG